jgi:HAD superfamily hydrolase (TIGR01450 family)
MTTQEFDLERYGAAVFDLDGTVWLSEVPIPGAVEWVEHCRDCGLTITFATNATFYSIPEITGHLQSCGLSRPGDAVVTGGFVVARSVAAQGVDEVVGLVPPAMRVSLEAERVAVRLPNDIDRGIDNWMTPMPSRALVMGASREATFGEIELIGRLHQHGHPLYVTSLDPGFPGLGRMEPGGGMMVTAARALYPIDPIVLGKPSRYYADVVADSVRSDGAIVMFGDSQRADIGIADFLGADGVLITGPGCTAARDDQPAPKYVTTRLGAAITAYVPEEI